MQDKQVHSICSRKRGRKGKDICYGEANEALWNCPRVLLIKVARKLEGCFGERFKIKLNAC